MRDNSRDLPQLSAAAAFSVAERTGLNAGCPSALFEEAGALFIPCGPRDRTRIAKRFAKPGRLPVDVPTGQSTLSQLHSASLIQPSGIKQLASSADISSMRSSPIVVRWPDRVWTAPIPGGALRRT